MNQSNQNHTKSDENFSFHTHLSALPAGREAAYLDEGFSGICTGGTALLEVFTTSYRISKNDLVVILPLQLVSIRDISEDFSLNFFRIGKHMFLDVMSGLCKMTPDFFFYMRRNFRYALTDAEVRRFLHFCNLIEFRLEKVQAIYRKETALHLFRVFYWDFYLHYKDNCEREKSVRFSNKESIAFRFTMLITEHHKEHRDVAFYAGKLCISPKYLTMVVREINGQAARDYIAGYVILEMKALLRDANLDIKDIVRLTGFPDQSSLSCYFRRHTGMSPSEYRKKMHML